MAEIQDVIETLDNAAEGFDTIANKTQKKIYGEVITLAKELDVDASGKVKQTIQNLKRLTQIKAKLASLAKDKEWVDGISKFTHYFDVLQKQQNAYFTQHFSEATLTETAKKKHELMKQMAVQNTIEALIGDGLKANVTDKLNDILLRAVTTNAKFADLQEELRAHLLGKEGGQGAFARYATTYATTALSQFTGQNNKLMTDNLGTEWFMYVGSNMETTREFCQLLTAKKYIHRSEIPMILTGKIDENQCRIYEKTGLPYGMIEGTTADNFQCNCGGWNCRHQLVPVADAVVPKKMRDRVAFTLHAQEKLDEYNEKRDELNLPTARGNVFAATPLAAIVIGTYEQLKIAVQSLYTAKTNREKRNILKSITQAEAYQPIPQVSSKEGKVYGYQGSQYNFKDEKEVPKNIHLAAKIAKEGRDVYLVPNPKHTTSADYIFVEDGKYYYVEGKVTTGKNGIYNGVKNGHDQSSRLVVDIEHALSAQDAVAQIKHAFNEYKSIQELWIYKGSVRIVITRNIVYSTRFEENFKKKWRQNK